MAQRNKNFFAGLTNAQPILERDAPPADGSAAPKKAKKDEFADIPEDYPLTKPSNEIVQAIAEALGAKLENISHARVFDGGWEAWLQVELAVELAKKKYHVVRRERPCWEPDESGTLSGRCDLWVEPRAGEAWVIELKVQNKDEKDEDVIKKFGKDMGKLMRNMTLDALSLAGNTGVKRIKLLSICVTAQPTAVSKGWSALQSTFQSTVKCTRIPKDNNPNQLAMLWWQPLWSGDSAAKKDSTPPKKPDPGAPFNFQPPGSGHTGGTGSGVSASARGAGFSYKL